MRPSSVNLLQPLLLLHLLLFTSSMTRCLIPSQPNGQTEGWFKATFFPVAAGAAPAAAPGPASPVTSLLVSPMDGLGPSSLIPVLSLNSTKLLLLLLLLHLQHVRVPNFNSPMCPDWRVYQV